MTLLDCTPGSLVVMIEHGLPVMVELGALLGKTHKKSGLVPWGALVTTIDHESLEPMDHTWRGANCDDEVIFVIATAAKRREIRNINRRVFMVSDGDVDPMKSWTRDARKQGAF